MKRAFTFLISLMMMSCAPIYVNYDYETGADFSKYKTYQLFPELQTGLSELDEKRLINALDGHLQNRGYTISDTPDFYINITSAEFHADRQSTVGVGVGGGGRNVGGGISVGIPIGTTNVTRELVFDLIDGQKDLLFWQAVSESGFSENASPEKREERMRAIVAKVFSKFPPEK